MACIAVPAEGEEPQSIVDRLIDTPNMLLTLLRATSLAAATDVLVRVKSHNPDVDMAKVKGGADTMKDLKALELEVEDAAMEVMDNIDYEGEVATSSLGLGAVPPPPLIICKQCFRNIFEKP
jgi:hypothetical protein